MNSWAYSIAVSCRLPSPLPDLDPSFWVPGGWDPPSGGDIPSNETKNGAWSRSIFAAPSARCGSPLPSPRQR